MQYNNGCIGRRGKAPSKGFTMLVIKKILIVETMLFKAVADVPSRIRVAERFSVKEETRAPS